MSLLFTLATTVAFVGRMRRAPLCAALAGAYTALVAPMLYADHQLDLDEVQVTGTVDSRILEYPATVESVSKQQIDDSINATTAAQTMKFLPSLQIRERFIGDRNGIIAGRTVGTLSSAQTMLYADGVLLSNLLGNSFAFPPRWGMISPDEIAQISMMYGPFSALYAGNSFGGVVSVKTRMPQRLEAHSNVQLFQQRFDLYGTQSSLEGQHLSASLGNRWNDLSVLLSADYLKSEGQPMDFVVRDVSQGSQSAGGLAVTGAFSDQNDRNQPRRVFGAVSMERPEQTNLKLKAVYDLTDRVTLGYTLGVWQLNNRTDVQSYLRDANGNAVYNNRVNLNGLRYDLTGFSPARAEATHLMQALTLKSNSKGPLDWQLTLSDYDYQQDRNSQSNIASAATASVTAGDPYQNRIGRVTDLDGTGWQTWDARVTWRPSQTFWGKHVLDLGYHLDSYTLNSRTFNTADWQVGERGSLNNSSRGNTRTQALFVQDKWQWHPHWSATLGARAERWQAQDGRNQAVNQGVFSTADYADSRQTRVSPKLSISYEPLPEWGFRASFGQAYRFPTVSELYQQVLQSNQLVQNNPNLKPESVLATELTAERRFAQGLFRVSLFNEDKYDALIGQTLPVGRAVPFGSGICTAANGCSFIQNLDHVRTRGIELATEWQDVWLHGLDILGSATFTDAEIVRNRADPSIEGNQATRIPRQMLKLVATYHQGQAVTYSLSARYSGRQYNLLDNSDVNDDTYIAASRFLFIDAKVNLHMSKRWTASVGIDNLNNDQAYVRHPYPQRTGYLQLKFDY